MMSFWKVYTSVYNYPETVYKLANQRRHPIHNIVLLYSPSVALKLIQYEQ